MFNHMIDYLSLFSFQRSVPAKLDYIQPRTTFLLKCFTNWRLDYNNMLSCSCQHVFYNLFQNFVISVSARNYIYILKRLSTNIDFIQCLLTNKQSPQTTVLLLQYKGLRCATPNFKISQTFFYFSLYSRFRYLIYYIQYL